MSSLVNPFDQNVSIQDYLAKGGNINIYQNGVSLVKHLLDCFTEHPEHKNSLLDILCHPDCVTDHLDIQDSLISHLSLFRLCIKRSKSDLSTFINRFKLEHELYNTPKVNWLTYLLSSESRFYIFMYFLQYHNDIRQFIHVTDKREKNVWHQLGYHIVTKNTHPNNIRLSKNIFTNLFNIFPEGLLQRNVDDYSVLELMENVTPYSTEYNTQMSDILEQLKKYEIIMFSKTKTSFQK